MAKSPTISTPPPGYVRHTASGCVIPSSEVPTHEAALGADAARAASSGGTTSPSEAQARLEKAASEAQGIAAKVLAENERLRDRVAAMEAAAKSTPPSP